MKSKILKNIKSIQPENLAIMWQQVTMYYLNDGLKILHIIILKICYQCADEKEVYIDLLIKNH